MTYDFAREAYSFNILRTGRRHLDDVELTYIQHAFFSFGLGVDMAIGAVCAAIHGIFPGLFLTSSADITKKLSNKLENMSKRKE